MSVREIATGWRRLLGMGVLLLALWPSAAGAVDRFWVGSAYYGHTWTTDAAWNPYGRPQAGDNVCITTTSPVNGGDPSPDRTYTLLFLDSGGSLNQDNTRLYTTAQSATVGSMGWGSWYNYTAIDTINQELRLGYVAGGTGTYILSQNVDRGLSGSLSSPYTFVGVSGTGYFYQYAGSNTSTNLHLGFKAGGSGYYELSGSGSTLSAPNIYVGNQGSGTFKQSGGAATVGQVLYLANYASGVGSYELSGGNLSPQDALVGNVGLGTFTQTGGAHTVSRYLIMGNASGSRGTYNLSGGSLSAPTSIVGNNSQGTFIHSGGAHNISDSLLVGNNAGAVGSYELSGTGSLSSPYQYIGNYGAGAFTQIGGTNTVTNALYLATAAGSSGTYNLQGGSLSATTINLKSGGAFNLQGGALSFTTFNQQGGGVTGTLENPVSGTFNYSGGTFSGRLINRGAVNFNADFTAGDGLANYSGLTIGAGRTVTLNGQGLDNQGTITLSGGALGGSGPLANKAALTGYGTINTAAGLSNTGAMTLTGGSSTVAGTVTNQAQGQLNITGSQAAFTGDVTNYGQVKTTNANVSFGGTYTEHGSYLSDPSIQTFATLKVEPTGYLVGSVGDEWRITQDFINRSAMNASWNTRNAQLSFISGAGNAHQFYLPGNDLGAVWDGYDNNFAWGLLDLSGQTLALFDGNDTLGGAFYVHGILGVTFTGLQVTDITGYGLNIYYDATTAENIYLHGLTYDLLEGGRLIPIGAAVPVPATFWLFLTGIAGLYAAAKVKNLKYEILRGAQNDKHVVSQRFHINYT